MEKIKKGLIILLMIISMLSINIERVEALNIEILSVATASKKKSSNNYLKELIIEGVNIDFKSKKQTYDITVDNVKNLKINAITKNDNASVYITYPEKYVEGLNKITIKVVAENKKYRTYTINVNYNPKKEESKKEENKQEEIKQESEKKESKETNINEHIKEVNPLISNSILAFLFALLMFMFYISKLLKDADKEDKPKKTVNENKKTQKLTLKKTTTTKKKTNKTKVKYKNNAKKSEDIIVKDKRFEKMFDAEYQLKIKGQKPKIETKKQAKKDIKIEKVDETKSKKIFDKKEVSLSIDEIKEKNNIKKKIEKENKTKKAETNKNKVEKNIKEEKKKTSKEITQKKEKKTKIAKSSKIEKATKENNNVVDDSIFEKLFESKDSNTNIDELREKQKIKRSKEQPKEEKKKLKTLITKTSKELLEEEKDINNEINEDLFNKMFDAEYQSELKGHNKKIISKKQDKNDETLYNSQEIDLSIFEKFIDDSNLNVKNIFAEEDKKTEYKRKYKRNKTQDEEE